MQRFEYIDQLKGLCILLVVVGHLSLWSLNEGENPITSFVALFHMQTFMFLSGLVISAAPGTSKLIEKLMKFMLPIVFVGSVYAYCTNIPLLCLWTDRMKLGYWYLFVLSVFYLILYLFRFTSSLSGKRGLLVDILILFGVMFVFSIFNLVLPHTIGSILSIDQIHFYWPYFFIGYLFRKYDLINSIASKNWFFTICLLLMIPCAYLNFVRVPHIWLVSSFPIVFVLLIVFKQTAQLRNRFGRELGRIGRKSLDVYIYHFFFLRCWGGYSFPEMGEWFVNTHNYFLQFLITLTISIITAYFCILLGKLVRKSRLLNMVVYGAKC